MSFKTFAGSSSKLCLNTITKATKATITKFQTISYRSIHNVPQLANDNIWSSKGIQNLYSPQGYQLAWKDYQTYLATQLTLLTSGTDLEQQNAFQTLLTTANVAHQSNIFHYASQLHNNHFFFAGLVEDPKQNTSVPSRELSRKVNESFGSFDQLKQQFLTQASELNNNGWVFLVENADKKLQIKSFNNEGSPYFYNRNQSVNLNAPIDLNQYAELAQHQVYVKEGKKDWTLPLLGVSVWDHAYLFDYGVDQKQKYLENVWNAIDWDVISKRVFILP